MDWLFGAGAFVAPGDSPGPRAYPFLNFRDLLVAPGRSIAIISPPIVAVQLRDGNIEDAADALVGEQKVDRATQLVRNEIANYIRSIARPLRDLDGRAAGFPPLDADARMRPVP